MYFYPILAVVPLLIFIYSIYISLRLIGLFRISIGLSRTKNAKKLARAKKYPAWITGPSIVIVLTVGYIYLVWGAQNFPIGRAVFAFTPCQNSAIDWFYFINGGFLRMSDLLDIARACP